MSTVKETERRYLGRGLGKKVFFGKDDGRRLEPPGGFNRWNVFRIVIKR